MWSILNVCSHIERGSYKLYIYFIFAPLIVTLIYNCIMKLSVYRIPSIMIDAQYPSNVENRNRCVCITPCLSADIERLQIFYFNVSFLDFHFKTLARFRVKTT